MFKGDAYKDWFVPLSIGFIEKKAGPTCGQKSLGSYANPRDVANAVKPSGDTIKPSVTPLPSHVKILDPFCCCPPEDRCTLKKCNKLALCQISQIVRVWVMKVWMSKYFEPPSVSHQAFPSNSESFPSNLESSVIFGAHSGEHGTRCVWNRWDLKFYVNSCVKMSSAHVSLVTCGIFPCEPNLDWRVTISKF